MEVPNTAGPSEMFPLLVPVPPPACVDISSGVWEASPFFRPQVSSLWGGHVVIQGENVY